jgi:hypothetical protein
MMELSGNAKFLVAVVGCALGFWGLMYAVAYLSRRQWVKRFARSARQDRRWLRALVLLAIFGMIVYIDTWHP